MEELNSIQFELNAPKGQYNSFGKYKYRSCEDILAAVKPLLKKYKCVLLLSDEVKEVGSPYTYNVQESDSRGGKSSSAAYNGTRVYVVATATIINAAGDKLSVSAMAREEVAKKGMDAAQLTGATSSYARKYALNGLFAIDDNPDADKLNASPEYTQQPQQQQQVQQQPAKQQPAVTGATVKKAIEEANKKANIEDLKAFWNQVFTKYPSMQSNEQFNGALFQKASAIAIEELQKVSNQDEELLFIDRWTDMYGERILAENTPLGNAIIEKRKTYQA